MKRAVQGFTVVELLITLVVMATLLAVGFVGLRGTQIEARDAERRSDIAAIARGLENYYSRGNSRVVGYPTKGTYPSANEFVHMQGWDWCGHATLGTAFSPCSVQTGYLSEALPGVSTGALVSPDSVSLTSTWVASDPTIQGYLDQGKYVYKPLDSTGSSTCYANGCPRYNLMYRQEKTSTIITVKSRHQ